MATQTITFDESRFSPLLGQVLIDNLPPASNGFTDSIAAGGTDAQFLIGQGTLLLATGPGSRKLMFTRFPNGTLNPVRATGVMVIRWPVGQRFISMRLASDFIGSGAAPLNVEFYAATGTPPGTAFQTQSFATLFDIPPALVFNSTTQTVREVRIVSRAAENTLDDLIFSDAPQTTLHDVAAVFDGSGSMNAQGKWPAMVEAGDLFHDLYRALGDPADTFGAVLFRGNCSAVVGPSPISVLASLAALSAGVDLPTLFAAESAHGCTPIGEAMVAAGTLVAGGSNPTKSVLLLTDGINNEGRSVADADVAAELLGVGVNVVGLGTGTQIDPVAIADLATHHGGSFRHTVNPSEVADFFVQALSQILGKAELAVVTGNDAVIAPGTTKAVFLVSWDVGTPLIDFFLQSPDGNLFTPPSPLPAGMVQSISYSVGSAQSFHSFYVVQGADLGGTWTFQGVPPRGRKLAVEDLRLQIKWSISPKLGLTGAPIVVRASITDTGKPFDGKAKVIASVTSPADSLGHVMATGGQQRGRNTLVADPNQRGTLAARGLKALGLKGIGLNQIEPLAFSNVAPGIYELQFNATVQDGIYRFDLQAHSETQKLPFARRLSLFAVLVSSPGSASAVQVQPVASGLVRLVVMPQRRDKLPIGPFLARWISIKPSHGKLLDTLTDHLDGSYSQLLAWDGKGALRVTLNVLGQDFKCAAPELKTDKPTKPTKLEPSKKVTGKAAKDVKAVKIVKAGKKKK